MFTVTSFFDISLKQASMWFAIWLILASSFSTLFVAYLMSIWGTYGFSFPDKNRYLQANAVEDGFFMSLRSYFYVFVLVLSVFWLASGVVLLLGIIKNQPAFLLPILFYDGLLQVLSVAIIIAMCGYITICYAYLDSLWLMLGVFCVLLQGPAILMWVGIFSLYKEMKGE